MTKTFDVCLRGDGIVGRSLALLLARARLRVALVRGPEAPGKPDVRAYALNAASRRLLEDLRCWPAEPHSTPVTQMRVWGDDGGQIDFQPATGDAAELAWLVDVPALEDQLAQALRFAPEVQWVDSPDDARAPLTVVCEGARSSSRLAMGAQWTVKPYAQKALAARLVSDQPHGGVARQWFNQGEVLALLPLGGTGASGLALVWSVSMARAEALQQLTPEAFTQALQNAVGTETGQLSLSSDVTGWPLALAQAQRWVGPGWALAGDAAHTVHPLAGQGLNLGLGDVRVLAQVLAEREYWRDLGDEKLLRRYERARKADVAAMSAVTDGLHSLFAHTDTRWQALRNWGMREVARSGPLKTWLTRQAAGL